MTSANTTICALRRDKASRNVVRAWRSLTGGRSVRDLGRRTLLACSGGADSTALVLALGSRPACVVVGHVMHDFRPKADVRGDRDAVKGLAESLGLEFVEAAVKVRELSGNAEANGRRRRYAALARMAAEHGCPFVAVGHQGDDMVETVLMRLVRGAGPRGMAAMRPTVRLTDGVTLVRPMLGVTRADSERLCALGGVSWRQDATNQDDSRLRAGLRVLVMPELRRLVPRMHERLAAGNTIFTDAAELMEERAASVLAGAARSPDSVILNRATLREESTGIVGEVVRAIGREWKIRADRMAALRLMHMARFVASRSGEERRFEFPGMRVTVTRQEVRATRFART